MSEAVEEKLEQLRAENAALNEQLKLLVMTEQRLYRSQNDLDRQFERVRALAEYALHCAQIESPDEILTGGALLLHDVFQIDDVAFLRIEENGTLAVIKDFDAHGESHQTVLSVAPSSFDWIRRLNESVLVSIPGKAAESRLPDRLKAIEQAYHNAVPSEEASTEQLCVPLSSTMGTLEGLILIGYDVSNNSFYKEHPERQHIPFLELFANHISRALHNTQLTSDLRERGYQIAQANHQLTLSLARLEASERRFRQLAENIREVFWISDPHEDRITYLSPAFRELWERDPEPAADARSPMIAGIHPDDLDRFLQRREKHLSGQGTQIEYRVVRPDGTERWVWDRGFPIRDDEGNVSLVCGIAEDITRRKQTAEELGRLQRLEMAGKIAGQIAHDFNNLLAPLTAYPQIIREQLPPGDSMRRMLTTMETAAGRIADINQQLLALGRRGHYDLAPLDLNPVIEDAIGALNIDPQFRVHLDLASDLFPVLGGASQLARVVTNLVSNACDAMSTGGDLRIGTSNVYVDEKQLGYKSIGRGEFVLLEISDSGAGIDPAVIDRVFDPFFSTKEMDPQRGSGLGLSVVHGVVTDHRGAVDVHSKIGEGSTFSVYLPVVRGAPLPVAEDDIVERARGESLLLVDDDPLQLEVVTSMLETLGYRVNCVCSGEEAINRISMYNPDLVLLDMIMGGIDGTETLKRILEWRPEQKVILVSGFARIERIEEARQLGARRFLPKPLTLRPLARAIRETLDDD
jgi:two-component system cell cycle sensor histidine kinase/response regulator CckA